MKTTFAILLSVLLFGTCHAADLTTATDPASTPKVTKATAASNPSAKTTTTKPAAKKTAAPTKSAAKTVRPRNPLRTEAELSGFSSETSDSYYGRISLVNTTPKQNWWIKTAYRDTTSRTYGKTKVTETELSGYDLDTYFRLNSSNAYRFASFVAGSRKRTPVSSSYYDSSDFRMLSAGYGRSVLPGVDLEASIAHIVREKEGTDDRITPMYTIRMKKPVSTSVVMDADVHLIQPFSENALVDSRMNLTYRFTPTLSMRLTYVANNVLGTTLTRHEWDKLFRVSLVFSR